MPSFRSVRGRALRVRSLSFALVTITAACGDDGGSHGDDDHHDHDAAPTGLAHTLFVAHEGALVSYDVATGLERPGTVTNVTGPVDLQALDDGHLIVNLGGRNETLIVDPTSMLEVVRIPSSAQGGLRPTHGFLSPVLAGRQLWMTLNDGDGTAASNSARFIDVTAGSATRFQAVGEVALGIGHHKAAFSKTRPRVVISSIGDCNDLLTVVDFTDPAHPTRVETLTAVEAGWDGVTKVCEGAGRPSPHGCATSPTSGKAYCSLTGTGELAIIDLDAEVPTFTTIPTGGKGGGYTQVHPGGRYAYTMQSQPRDGGTGVACQIGQLVITDTTTDTVARELPVRYTGPDCATALAGDETAVSPDHTYWSHDGGTLFIALNAGFGNAAARSRQVLAIDTRDPAAPVQLPSIAVGVSTSHGAGTVDGPGTRVYVVNAIDGTVSEIDAATRAVLRTLDVGDNPKNVATFGGAEGPSHQTGPVE
jgi:YVTN family beta-propeller protein